MIKPKLFLFAFPKFFILYFNVASYFQLKKYVFLVSDRFLNNAGKPGSPSVEILFPHEKLLQGNILQLNLQICIIIFLGFHKVDRNAQE